MTEEKKKHRNRQEDFSEISFDFLADDDCVYSPFDKNYDVPFIIPTEASSAEEEKEAAETFSLSLSDIPELVLDFAEYLGDEIISFVLLFYNILSPLVAIPVSFIISVLRKTFLSLKTIRLLPSSFRI